MMPRPPRLIRRCRLAARSLLSGLLAIWYVVLMIGVPLPAVSSSADQVAANSPFPCQHHRCGCRDSERCWRDCCCFSMEEKLAWAQQNNVEPPAYVVEAALAARQAKQTATKKKCCCSSNCETKQAESKPQATVTQRPSHGTTWIVLIDAQRCRGEAGGSFTQVSVATVPPLPITSPSFRDRTSDLPQFSSLVPPSVAFAPPDPPPRVA